MSSEEIINGSKLIAEYLGFVYIPFSADLKERGLKPGWYKTVDATPKMEEVRQTSSILGKEEVKTITININNLRYNKKNGYKLVGDKYYRYICRNHGELRFWNKLDSLIPVIQRIKKELNVEIWINANGAEHTDFADKNYKTKICQSYDSSLRLSNNVFIVVIETLTHLEKYWNIQKK